MLIEKKELPLVAMDFMNDVHFEDVEIINEIFELILNYEAISDEANRENLANKYSQWVEHTIAHFQGEEVLMEAKKFPPYPFHKGEHDKALHEMKSIFENWQNSGDIREMKIYFIEILPHWLTQHILGMDTVTAMFFKTGLSPCSMR